MRERGIGERGRGRGRGGGRGRGREREKEGVSERVREGGRGGVGSCLSTNLVSHLNLEVM